MVTALLICTFGFAYSIKKRFCDDTAHNVVLAEQIIQFSIKALRPSYKHPRGMVWLSPFQQLPTTYVLADVTTLLMSTHNLCFGRGFFNEYVLTTCFYINGETRITVLKLLELHRKETCLWGFHHGLTYARLCSHRRWLEV